LVINSKSVFAVSSLEYPILKSDYRAFWVNNLNNSSKEPLKKMNFSNEFTYRVPAESRLTSIKDSLLVEYGKNRTKTLLYQTVGGFVASAGISFVYLYFATNGFEDNSDESIGAAFGLMFKVFKAAIIYSFTRPLFINTFGNTDKLEGSYWKTFLIYHATSYAIAGLYTLGSKFVNVKNRNYLLPILVLSDLTCAYVASKYHTKTLKLRKSYVQELKFSAAPTVVQSYDGKFTLGVGLSLKF
jgi:hypothetical protein